MTPSEVMQADFGILNLTAGEHPMSLLRERLNGICPANDLQHIARGQIASNGTHVKAEEIEPFRAADFSTQTSPDFH